METILSIFFSTLFSAIIAVAVTRYYYKKQIKKKEITHFLIKSYDIGKGLREVFPDFKISYNNDELAKYVRVYEGYFKNTGYNDVSDNENIAIKMIFPQNCVVKAVKVRPLSRDLIVESTIGKNINEVQFVIGKLLKTKQSFEYTAIVESSENVSDSSGDLMFSHMLPDTDIQDGNKLFDASEKDFKSFLNRSMYITLFCGLFFILLAYFKGKEYPSLHGVAAILLVLYALSIYIYKLFFSRRVRNLFS